MEMNDAASALRRFIARCSSPSASKISKTHQTGTTSYFDFLAQSGYSIDEDFEGDTNKLPVLEYFESALFATTLEDAILKIRLLVDSNSAVAMNKVKVDIHKHLLTKFSVEETKPDADDELPKKPLESDEYKLYKMDNDRILCTESICDTYIDLALRLHYKSLTAKIAEIEAKNTEIGDVKDTRNRNKRTLRELRKKLLHLKVHNRGELYETNCKIDKLQKQIEDTGLLTEIKGRYVTSWENSRREQHNYKLKTEETETEQSIRCYRTRLEKEQRAHSEIEQLVNAVITETMHEVEYWMEKYERDSEELDLMIQKQRVEYEVAFDTRAQLEEHYALREKEINSWTTFKEERASKQKYTDDMNRAAIVIQAWWRGFLVRNELGPYKPKKKKAPKKK